MKIYKERPELLRLVKAISQDHALLSSLEPKSYVATFIHSVMKMRIDDPIVWSSLASFVAKNH